MGNLSHVRFCLSEWTITSRRFSKACPRFSFGSGYRFIDNSYIDNCLWKCVLQRLSCSQLACDWMTGRKRSHSDSILLTAAWQLYRHRLWLRHRRAAGSKAYIAGYNAVQAYIAVLKRFKTFFFKRNTCHVFGELQLSCFPPLWVRHRWSSHSIELYAFRQRDAVKRGRLLMLLLRQ